MVYKTKLHDVFNILTSLFCIVALNYKNSCTATVNRVKEYILFLLLIISPCRYQLMRMVFNRAI